MSPTGNRGQQPLLLKVPYPSAHRRRHAQRRGNGADVPWTFPFRSCPRSSSWTVSELPALLASFSIGPWYGIAVCLVKNLINCLRTSTGGVGELCNFLLGAIFTWAPQVLFISSSIITRAVWARFSVR